MQIIITLQKAAHLEQFILDVLGGSCVFLQKLKLFSDVNGCGIGGNGTGVY